MTLIEAQLKDFEKVLHKQDFLKLLWGLGKLNMTYRQSVYKLILEIILSEDSKNSGIKELNLKDIQTVLESVRPFCQRSDYD